MGYPTLTIQSDDAIARLAFTVPEKRNAVSSQMITDLLAALEQAQESSGARPHNHWSGQSLLRRNGPRRVQAMGKQTTPETSKIRGASRSFSTVCTAFPNQ